MQSKVFTKSVTEKEFLFTLIASRENIAPKLINWSKNNDNTRFTIHSEKYFSELTDEPAWNIYKNDAVMLVSKLHSLGIFHGDITEENFVVNPKTKEIKLIDYGRSCWITNIDEKNLTTYQYIAKTKEQLPEMEMKEVKWLLNHDQRNNAKILANI